MAPGGSGPRSRAQSGGRSGLCGALRRCNRGPALGGSCVGDGGSRSGGRPFRKARRQPRRRGSRGVRRYCALAIGRFRPGLPAVGSGSRRAGDVRPFGLGLDPGGAATVGRAAGVPARPHPYGAGRDDGSDGVDVRRVLDDCPRGEPSRRPACVRCLGPRTCGSGAFASLARWRRFALVGIRCTWRADS